MSEVKDSHSNEPAVGQAYLVIRKLEWRPMWGHDDSVVADTDIGHYRIDKLSDDRGFNAYGDEVGEFNDQPEYGGKYRTLEEAKSACQKNYEKRVRWSLVEAPLPVGLVVKLLEWTDKYKIDDRTGFVLSEGGILSYSISLSRLRVYGVPGEHDGAAEFSCLDEAKAAAQAHYETRIRSALLDTNH